MNMLYMIWGIILISLGILFLGYTVFYALIVYKIIVIEE